MMIQIVLDNNLVGVKHATFELANGGAVLRRRYKHASLPTTMQQESMKSRRRFKNTYELLNPRALRISTLYFNRIFQCMGKIFYVEFQRYPLKFHTKYLTPTLKDVYFILPWKCESSKI